MQRERCVIHNKDDRKKNQALESAYQNYGGLFNSAFHATDNPDPVEELLRNEATTFLRGIQGKDGPVDVRKFMGPEVGMYDDAVAAREDDTDIGAAGMDIGSANPLALARLKESRGAHRQERAAGALERAYTNKYNTITGRIAPTVVGMEADRLQSRQGLAGSMANSSLNAWANFRPRPGFMENLLMSAAQGAGQGASMMAGGA